MYSGEDSKFLPARLMELLLEYRRGDYTKYAAVAEVEANRAEAARDWRRAREYWQLAARWHARNSDGENETRSLLAAVRTYEQAATDAASRTSPSYAEAAQGLRSAIEALRRIPNTQEYVKQLHHLLLQYQERSIDEFTVSSVDVDISRPVQVSREAVKGKSLYDAVLAVALCWLLRSSGPLLPHQ
jgi:hypothetical protein